MNDQQLEELKQFIDGRISQAESRVDQNLYEKIEELRKEMLDGFAGIGEAIEEINKHIDERLSRLEKQPA